MQNEGIARGTGDTPAQGNAVSADNPCPFLRAAVASGFLDGHVVPVSKLVSAVEAASGETGGKAKLVGVKTWLVAVVANGLSPRRLPDRVAGRLMLRAGSSQPAGGPLRKLAKAVIVILALLGALVVAIAEFPDQVRKVAPSLLAQLLPPTLPVRAPVKTAVWLDQN